MSKRRGRRNPVQFQDRAIGRLSEDTILNSAYDLLQRSGIWGSGDIAFVEILKGKLVGALAMKQHVDRGTLVISFDLAVDERHRGKGLGRGLIDAAIDQGMKRAEFSFEPKAMFDIHVVNDLVLEMLRKRGFKITHRIGIDEWHATKRIR